MAIWGLWLQLGLMLGLELESGSGVGLGLGLALELGSGLGLGFGSELYVAVQLGDEPYSASKAEVLVKVRLGLCADAR